MIDIKKIFDEVFSDKPPVPLSHDETKINYQECECIKGHVLQTDGTPKPCESCDWHEAHK